MDIEAVASHPEAHARLRAAARLGLAPGVAGAYQDLELYATRPHELALSDIACETVIWAGGLDTTTPPAHARWYADAIPGASLHIVSPRCWMSFSVLDLVCALHSS